MKKRINLLTKKKDYIKRESFFKRVQKITYICGFIALSLTIIFYATNQRLQGEHKGLLFEKEQKITSLLVDKQGEKKISFINKKGDVLKKALEQDINFDTYYPYLHAYLLSEYNTESSNAATLEKIFIDNKQKLNLTFKLYNEESLYNLLYSTKQDPLLELFNELAIDKITSSGETYEVVLVGQLKKI